MLNIHVILMILAFVFFVLAAFGVPNTRFNFIGAGLALWVLSLLIT